MAGNVWQWCSSLMAPYPYQANDGREDPVKVGPRVIRGGAWYMTSNFARAANRYRILPYFMHFFDEREALNVGFRIAMSAAPESRPSSASTASLQRLAHPNLIMLVHENNKLPTPAEDEAHRLKADGSCKPGEIAGYAPTLAQAQRYPEADERLDVMERGGRGESLPAAVMAQIGLKKGDVIGDVGAGAGEFTATMADMVGPTGQVWATDIAVSALRYMQARMQNPNRWKGPTSNVYLVLTDVTDCLLPLQHFDYVFMSEVHYFYFPRANADASASLAQVVRFYRSIGRALKPGGRFVLFEINHFPPQNDPQRGTLSVDEITDEMKQAGFKRVDHQVDEVSVGRHRKWTFNLMVFQVDDTAAPADPNTPRDGNANLRESIRN
jgi:ubiquinone/menaquinone biosynthesis C-methylase UbiE